MSTITTILFFLIGFALVLLALLSAIRTFVLPRSAPDRITRTVFLSLRKFFDFALKFTRNYKQRDAIMAYYAPVSLLILLPTWLTIVLFGYAFFYMALGAETWIQALDISGSSLLTLGFSRATETTGTFLTFTEATIGLILVALLIAYLPTFNDAFSRREKAVNLLATRAGTPPTAVELLTRYSRLNSLNTLSGLWSTWENWFADVEESHTSLAALVFLRSPIPEQSWVNAAGAILDAASLYLSTLAHPIDAGEVQILSEQQLPSDPQAALCIRTGFLALRRIADFFEVEIDENPHFPEVPISITQEEFYEAYEIMKEQGLALKPDKLEAWNSFAGWRVNYDRVLMALTELTMAPSAPWAEGLSSIFLYSRTR